MIKLTIDPNSLLVQHEGVPEGMTLHVAPKSGEVTIKLESIENMSARDGEERMKKSAQQKLFDVGSIFITQAVTQLQQLSGTKSPCGCHDDPIFTSHRVPFDVVEKGGAITIMPAGIYQWEPGKPPKRVGDYPDGESGSSEEMH